MSFSIARQRRHPGNRPQHTFETVLGFESWPYGNKPVDLSAVRGGVVEQIGGTPAEIVAQLAASGAHHLYVDGGITIQRFLRGGWFND